MTQAIEQQPSTTPITDIALQVARILMKPEPTPTTAAKLRDVAQRAVTACGDDSLSADWLVRELETLYTVFIEAGRPEQ